MEGFAYAKAKCQQLTVKKPASDQYVAARGDGGQVLAAGAAGVASVRGGGGCPVLDSPSSSWVWLALQQPREGQSRAQEPSWWHFSTNPPTSQDIRRLNLKGRGGWRS